MARLTFLNSFLLLCFSLLCNFSAFAKIDPKDSRWQNYVAGKIEEIPNKNLKKYLLDIRDRNYYKQFIIDQLDSLGPFSPGQGTVFWVPSIDIPASDSNWRYLSSLREVSDEIRSVAMYTDSKGQNIIRMFLHPFTQDRPHFKNLAAKFGGFKFEHQGVATASPRSFILWKTSKSWDGKSPSKLDFPTNVKNIFRAKPSLFSINIDGSRINRAKKMVRASAVSYLFQNISSTNKRKFDFDFEAETLAAVPEKTDAGFIVRPVMPELVGSKTNVRVEPAFSLLTPERLNQLTKDSKNPLKLLTEEVFQPVGRTFAYLFFQEGMIGEFNTQNFEFVVNDKGMPTGKLLIHDADAFRVNLQLRALNGRDVTSPALIEYPFFYLKEAAFTQTQVVKDGAVGAVTLNSLMDYMVNAYDRTSMVWAIHDWCSKLSKKAAWCDPEKIRNAFLSKLAEEFSVHLERQVDVSELKFTRFDKGKVGLIKLFDERLTLLSELFSRKQVNPAIQADLHQEFMRLANAGLAKKFGKDAVGLSESDFILVSSEKASYIGVRSKKNPGKGLLAMALLQNAEANPKALAFWNKIDLRYQQKPSCLSNFTALTHPKFNYPLSPVMRSMGGGSNIPTYRGQ